MKDEEIARDALSKELQAPAAKVDPAVKYLGQLLDIIPAPYQNLALNVSLALIGVLWIVDVITPDPLPFIDEAGLTYLLYLLWKLKQTRSS